MKIGCIKNLIDEYITDQLEEYINDNFESDLELRELFDDSYYKKPKKSKKFKK